MTTSTTNHYQGKDLLHLLMKHEVPFTEGNIIKYVFRWKRKGGLADLLKAQDYLNELILKEQNGHQTLSTIHENNSSVSGSGSTGLSGNELFGTGVSIGSR